MTLAAVEEVMTDKKGHAIGLDSNLVVRREQCYAGIRDISSWVSCIPLYLGV